MPSRASAGRDHGFRRKRLCGLLRVRTPSGVAGKRRDRDRRPCWEPVIAPFPAWLPVLADVVLCLWTLCALVILADIAAGYRQHMWIMNAVWPVTALWAGPLALLGYFTHGLATRHVRLDGTCDLRLVR